MCTLCVCVPPHFFLCDCDHRHLHSFPTRRSSDLVSHRQGSPPPKRHARALGRVALVRHPRGQLSLLATWPGRSEEHTSELQSRRDLVCRLLLEKKNRYDTPAAAVARVPDRTFLTL